MRSLGKLEMTMVFRRKTIVSLSGDEGWQQIKDAL